jgi:hypothetical protein
MSLLGALEKLLGQNKPEITYNPDPRKNIPYSAHSMEMAKLGNQYVADPTNPRFLGVDPGQFGFPEDKLPYPRVVRNFGPQSQDTRPLTYLPQGGQFNPGYSQQPGTYTSQIQRGGWR